MIARTLSRGALALVAALAVTAPLSAQSAATQTPNGGTLLPGDRYPFYKADVDFLQGMIAHHNQAIVMAHWASSHGASKSVQIYCGRVAMAQTAEIGLMQQWLQDHHQNAPHPTEKDAMNGMSASMSGMQMASDTAMPGMLTAEQMKQLDHARGRQFDSLFLVDMIQHHTGAIHMVQSLFAANAAEDDFMFKFANDVQADQTTEIDRMQQMLDAMSTPGSK